MSPALEAITAYEKNDQNPLNGNSRHQHQLLPEDCIGSLSKLQQHINNREKHDKYDQLLQTMGMQTEFFSKLRQKPSFIFSHQPGHWFSIGYQSIIMLLQKLDDYFETNKEISGVHAFNNDRFTFGGQKKAFNQLYLANDLNIIHFVGKKFIEKNEGLAYPFVTIEKDDARNLRSIFDLALFILKHSQQEYPSFEKAINSLPHEIKNGQKRIDDFIPKGYELRKLYDILQLTYREKIIEDLKFASDSLMQPIEWNTFWNSLNQKIMEVEVKNADDLLNKYILAISDIHKLANWLAKVTQEAPGQPVPIINIIDPFSHKHYSVYYDFEKAAKKKFLYYTEKEDSEENQVPERQYLSIEEIMNLAEEGLTGGPSYIIKYILRAASHSYFLVDSITSANNTKHDVIIDKIHEQEIGIPYPWITTLRPINDDTSDIVPDNTSLIALYSPFHEIEKSTAVARFFAS